MQIIRGGCMVLPEQTIIKTLKNILQNFRAARPLVLALVCFGLARPLAGQPQSPPPNNQPDYFDTMVASSASFDMDSPVEIKAEFDPPVAAVGARVVYRLLVTALDESLEAPESLPLPAGLTLHRGGHGQTYQATGARKMRPLTTLIYRTIVTNIGEFTIPEFEVMAYGKPVKVPAATLKVVPASTVSQYEPPRMFLDLPEGDIYTGQLLKVTLILPLVPNGPMSGIAQPSVKGEFIFAEQFPLGMRQETLRRDGKEFHAYLQELLVTPMRAGQQELIGEGHSYMFRPIPGQANGQQMMNVLVDSEPVSVNVKPLPPEGRLPGFNGAVGTFMMEPPKLSLVEVNQGEPVTLTVIIRGNGNLGRMLPPTFPTLADWQGFPPAENSTPPFAIQQRGFASFTYTLIPLNSGTTATPPIPFSYFDPNKKAYVDLTVPAVPLKVLAVKDTAAQPAPELPDAGAENSGGKEKDPVFAGLMKTPGAPTSLTPWQQRRGFFLLQLIPAMLLGGTWLWSRHRRFLELHPEVILKIRARRGLRRERRRARRAASAGDMPGFAQSAANALREACAPHTAANPQALVCADVLRELPEAQREGDPGKMVRNLFAVTDASRFDERQPDAGKVLSWQAEWEALLNQLKARL